jgi:phosphotransferase system HPr-like phosphotransfer protein
VNVICDGKEAVKKRQSPVGLIIAEETFRLLISSRTDELLSISLYIKKHCHNKNCFTRPLLGDILSEATKIEELLDAYGVRNNQRWYPFRELVATIKLFANVSYILLHLKHSVPTYNLLSIENDFLKATDEAFSFTCKILVSVVACLLKQAENLKIYLPEHIPGEKSFIEELPPGQLPIDRKSRQVSSAEETVVYLATAFLNLADASSFLHIPHKERTQSYRDYIPDPISEEKLRNLEYKFHNLQSLYDTHISDSNVESLDENLPVLRGHVSVIFHLLETATALTHYCERHVLISESKKVHINSCLIDYTPLFEVLVNYSLCFSSLYIKKGRKLCQLMLKSYAKQGQIVVFVPRYRGFHVRPSTLIAKIVNHYGSEVCMKLGSETYNASYTLDIFRANEVLNAKKKHKLAEEAALVIKNGSYDEAGDLVRSVRTVIKILMESDKVVIYELKLPLEQIISLEDETPYQSIIRVLTQLFVMGKIDMEVDVQVSFSGDLRVLADIKLLAEHGYGEDDAGNNLDLPETLSYLRK